MFRLSRGLSTANESMRAIQHQDSNTVTVRASLYLRRGSRHRTELPVTLVYAAPRNHEEPCRWLHAAGSQSQLPRRLVPSAEAFLHHGNELVNQNPQVNSPTGMSVVYHVPDRRYL